MAAALGEDVPTLFAKKMPAEEERGVVDPAVIVEDLVPDAAPLGLADAMQLQQEQQEQQAESEAPAAAEEAPVPSSNVVLLEQAERQARIQGTSPESSFVAGDFSLGVSSRLAGLSVTTPPPTPTPTTTPTTLSSTPQQSRKLRRQTIADFAPTTEAEEQSVDEILAHRQRLRRIQDRKRRRQTVADLNKRRSSWRGWMPSANLVDSPPSSPEPHHVADWSTPRVSIKGKEDNASSLVSPTNTLMYPPTAWNTEGESPTKRRRMRGIADIVVSVLGMSPKPASIELANDPKHGTRQPAPAAEPKAFAYPPRPVPIDADWEKIDVDNAEERLAKEKEAAAEQDIVAEASSQQVELYAVSGPASDVDSANNIASLNAGRQGAVIMTATIDRVRKDQAQFTYQGKMTNGGFDVTKSTWAFHDFDGKRYDWMAGIMQNCWKLEDSEGHVVAQYIGMSRDYKVKATLSFQTKVSESLISLVLLTTKLINYEEASRR
ncbi:hypothetical protein GGI19_005667 [Coemansia pectinata]|uniref:Uncharacterized protein n=1 Tax=Coemansia pectinata TaxID=1052879 RepID=A0A9W8GRW7_9FUNG|nr:hypothetical protein GGI19_005667 [Coemansia pectinata]